MNKFEKKATKVLKAVEKLGPTGLGILSNAQLNRFYGEIFRGTDRVTKKSKKK